MPDNFKSEDRQQVCLTIYTGLLITASQRTFFVAFVRPKFICQDKMTDQNLYRWHVITLCPVECPVKLNIDQTSCQINLRFLSAALYTYVAVTGRNEH